MKKFLFFLLVSAGMVACSKNDNQVDPPVNNGSSSYRIKTKTSSGVNSYEYDGQGRISKSTYTGGSGYIYEYQPGKVIVKILGPGGVQNNTDTYTLNADGFCTKLESANLSNYTDEFFYNSDKTLAKNIFGKPGSMITKDYYYSNGNLDSTRVTKNGQWQYTEIRTYFTDKANVLSDMTTGENFFGKIDKNLLKSEYNRSNDGSFTTPAEYSYEFDAKGRVIKETLTNGNNIGVTLITYY